MCVCVCSQEHFIVNFRPDSTVNLFTKQQCGCVKHKERKWFERNQAEAPCWAEYSYRQITNRRPVQMSAWRRRNGRCGPGTMRGFSCSQPRDMDCNGDTWRQMEASDKDNHTWPTDLKVNAANVVAKRNIYWLMYITTVRIWWFY